jgi:hypothetical protein
MAMTTASVEQPTPATEQPTAVLQTTQTEQPAATVQQSLTGLGSFDALLKYLAAFTVLLYCCGYFVSSVSSLGWGFYQVAPLRPKIASAGAWFILFLGVPLAAVAFQRKEKPGWVTGAASFHFYAMWGAGLGFATDSLFEFSFLRAGPHTFFIPTTMFFGYFAILIISGKGRTATTIKWAISVGSILFVAGSGFYDLYKYHLVTISAVFLWYLIVGASSTVAFKSFAGRDFLESLTRSVPYAVSQLLIALSYFGSVYYPHIKASWGGGAPVPVTILFAKESPILPGQYLSTQLLDESDAGLYIAGKNEKKASFIPRNEIASITYSDSPSVELQSKLK